MTTLTVTEKVSRLDRFLHRQYPLISINRWRQVLSTGEILLDGCRAVKGAALRPGQKVSFVTGLPEQLASATLPPEIVSSLEVLYEDADIIAVNKPANCHTHPLSISESGTLANHLIAAFPELSGIGGFGPLQPGLLNRLDFATSGVVLVARSNQVWSELRLNFAEHRIRKVYLAEIEGRLPEEMVIEKALTHDRKDARRMLVTPPAKPCRGVYPARTEVLPLKFSASANLTRVRLVMYSGVMHQLRVHLADAGHPISGDLLYGSSPSLPADEQNSGAVSSSNFHLHCAEMRLADGRIIVASVPEWGEI